MSPVAEVVVLKRATAFSASGHDSRPPLPPGRRTADGPSTRRCALAADPDPDRRVANHGMAACIVGCQPVGADWQRVKLAVMSARRGLAAAHGGDLGLGKA